jgi:pimeloyl-ACP methyl ester carboxylesterase
VFRVRLPPDAAVPGVFVFIPAQGSGELPEPWAPVLDEKELVWIAADGYGNSRPTAERMLVAVMALKLAQRLQKTDLRRHYVSGISGGGRVASQCITHFPQRFTGAFFMVGADFHMPRETETARLVGTRRMVLLTGSRDFNRRELQGVYRRYRGAGVSSMLLIDEDGFGHEPATAQHLATAIDFLDAR